ncbi:hypothetical protein [Aureimonas sp. SK2]|uniref:hypothetical protein n=1 Tax=Aureimonas sp. SK2 TaxID=3015992 RepID=UPI002443FF6D|nr:hypothetical protein [Aureimonas sp. SK2]
MESAPELSPGLTVTPGVDFPLPPPDLAEALINSPAAEPTAPLPPPTIPALPPMVAVLDFLDGPPGETVQLRYPFRLEGEEVREIRVRPLLVSEVGSIITALGGRIDNYVFYGAMTGLPTEVVRALPGEDGDRVTDVAYGFLPRYLKPADPGSPSTPENGAP